jgi:Uma2 family endonuclease
MQQPAMKYFTPEEYLAMEETSDIRHEYYQGEIFAMAGGSVNHNRVNKNLDRHFESGLSGKPCEAFMDNMRLWIKANGLFTYPDLMVVCGEPEFYEGRDDMITNPVVIIEVLSKTTQDYDCGGKFKLYRSIPSLQEYVVIDQYAVHVEQYYLEAPNKWIFTEYNQITDALQFAKIDFQIALRDVYYRVQFAEGGA